MLIRIHSSVVDNEDYNVWSQETIQALEILAIARREGKHSVIAERETLEKISECSRLSENIRSVYKQLFLRSAELRGYLSHVTKYIEVVNPCLEPNLDEITHRDKKIIKVPPCFFNDSALIQKAILMCENIEDAAFYEKIARIYLLWKKINIKIECEHMGGGGSTITEQFINIQNLKKLCLCIVDSDRITFNGKLGNTANRIKSEHNENCIITELLILDLHEIENLIPNSILSNLCLGNVNRQEALVIIEDIETSSIKDLRGFLDIKNGTSMGKIINTNNPIDRDFWQPRISKSPNILTRVDDWCLNNWSCSKYEPIKDKNRAIKSIKVDICKICNCKISLGFGENILEQASLHIGHNYHGISRIIDESVRIEWEKVGQIILNWCFAENPIRT